MSSNSWSGRQEILLLLRNLKFHRNFLNGPKSKTYSKPYESIPHPLTSYILPSYITQVLFSLHTSDQILSICPVF